MGQSRSKRNLKNIRVGLIGAGQIAKTHLLALSSIPMLYNMNTIRAEFSAVAEANDGLAAEAASKYGFSSWSADWRKVTRSDNVDLVDIITPTYLHPEPTIDAAEHGKHVICEKPLAITSKQAREMYETAENAGVVHMVGFNYRRLPAVAFCKNVVASGKLGKIYQFTSSFMEDWGADPNFPLTWRFQSTTAGAGVLADLGSHVIDLARFLVGDIKSVCATQGRFLKERPMQGTSSKRGKVDIDDTTMSLLKFSNGVIGRIEASWCAWGRKVGFEFEINGSEGSVYYNLERPNEVQIYSKDDPKDIQGYRTVFMGPIHPYGKGMIFPAAGAGMGFEESIVNEFYDFLNVIVDRNQKLSPTFYDGWKVNQVIEAIVDSAMNDRWASMS